MTGRRHHLGIAAATGFAALMFAQGAAPDRQIPQARASVRADRLKVSHEKRTASFEGNVEAVYGTLRIRCDRLEVRYGDDEGVESLEAQGHVRITREELEAHAQRARLDAQRFRLVLEGEPSVRRGAQTLEGRRVEIDLRTQEIEVLEARGVFELHGIKDGGR